MSYIDDPFAALLEADKADENADFTHPVLTDRACQRIVYIIENEEKIGAMLRISVEGGGCSGFQYRFNLDWQAHKGEHIYEQDGAKFVIDDKSLAFLNHAKIDYVDDLGGAYFKVDNPNAKSGCGCGTSFSI